MGQLGVKVRQVYYKEWRVVGKDHFRRLWIERVFLGIQSSWIMLAAGKKDQFEAVVVLKPAVFFESSNLHQLFVTSAL